MSELVSIAKTYGALLIGSLCASFLSGVLLVQCFLYGRIYRGDSAGLKTYVIAVWFLDSLHNIAIWSSMWTWIVVDFGRPEELDIIPIGIPLSIIVTALLTLLVHCFFVYRIFNLTTRRFLITIPILLLALLRLAAAMGTSHLMFKQSSLGLFKEQHTWIFSLGLALSSTVDVLITTVMMSILQCSRASSLSLDTVLDSLSLYTLENGAITTYVLLLSFSILVCG
ncbi:hypothetical protein L218DRAFT_470266 [Marasmius fiardii PR-910]|nr:hypothetical protein L218DRAFT_470266 [Marasmius fiardii PR-910]